MFGRKVAISFPSTGNSGVTKFKSYIRSDTELLLEILYHVYQEYINISNIICTCFVLLCIYMYIAIVIEWGNGIILLSYFHCNSKIKLYVVTNCMFLVTCLFNLGSCTFDSMTGAPLAAVVDTSYRETSKYLLQVLHTRYNFTEHLKVSILYCPYYYHADEASVLLTERSSVLLAS